MALVPYNANRSLKRAYDGGSVMPFAKRGYGRPVTYQNLNVSRANPNMVMTTRNRRRSRNGPYRQLTAVSRHTNPIYPRPESKSLDVFQTGALFTTPLVSSAVSNVGTINTINLLAQGVNNGQRIGLSVSLKSCAYRYEVDINSAGTVPVNGRCILIWDRQINAATPTVTDILNSSTYLSYLNLAAKDRFTVLRNDLWSLNPQGNTTVFFQGFVKINMQVTYATSGSSPVSGGLLLLMISDQTTSLPNLTGCWRMRYIDN